MSEQTPEEYRRAMRDQYSKQGADIGVVGILDELEQAYAQRDKLRDKLLEIAKGNCGSFQHDIPTFLAGLEKGDGDE